MRVLARNVVAGLAATVAVSVVAACGSSGSSASSASGGGSTSSGSGTSGVAPLRIALLAALSDPTLQLGAVSQENAAKAAIAAVNASGGVLGHPVQLQVLDEAGDPTTAATKLDSALSGSNPPIAVIQSDASTITAAVIPITNTAKVVNRHVEERSGPKLDEANIVVSGGRGFP